MTQIDVRSDTVTRPSAAMRAVMAKAEVGDDVFADDPSINALEARVADMLGQQAALLLPTGTQSNLVALLTHCGRGDEYIVGQDYHTYKYEAGGAACLGGIQPQPMPVEADGSLALTQVASLIKPDDYHFAKTRLLSLENTHSGKVISQAYLAQAENLAREHSLSLHLDGARVFNAAVAQGVTVAEICTRFDSVSICCSKGLGAPMGSLLAGSSDYIQQARRWRKMLGGGMRQAGIIAAAIDYALSHHVEALVEDHANAEYLVNALNQRLAGHPSIQVDAAATNMVYVNLATAEQGQALQAFLAEQNILVLGGKRLRLVTHRDVGRQSIARLAEVICSFLG